MSDDLKVAQLCKFLGAERLVLSDEYRVPCKNCNLRRDVSYTEMLSMFGQVMQGGGEQALWCRECREVHRAAELLTCYGEDEGFSWPDLVRASGVNLDDLAATWGVHRARGTMHAGNRGGEEDDQSLRERIIAIARGERSR